MIWTSIGPWPAATDPAALAGRAALIYGSEGWGFESLRARPVQRPLPVAEGAFLLTPLLTAVRPGGCYRAGENVGGLGELVADHMGVHAQCHGWVSVTEPGGHCVAASARATVNCARPLHQQAHGARLDCCGARWVGTAAQGRLAGKPRIAGTTAAMTPGLSTAA
jgi:hypothetical protein